MKITMLLVFLMVVSTAMFGQYGSIGSSSIQPATEPIYSVSEHPLHANHHDMRAEHSLLNNGGITTAQGERPLWECGDKTPEKPLGDVAREYRKLALYGSEKARIYWEQQGKK